MSTPIEIVDTIGAGIMSLIEQAEKDQAEAKAKNDTVTHAHIETLKTGIGLALEIVLDARASLVPHEPQQPTTDPLTPAP